MRFWMLLMNISTSASGVAYSKHIVHIFSYYGGDDLRNHLEVCVIYETFGNHLNIISCLYFISQYTHLLCMGFSIQMLIGFLPWNSFRLKLILVMLAILLSLNLTNSCASSLVGRTRQLRCALFGIYHCR